ncbi:hypothetical protein HNR03_000235 [Pseudomonas sp. JAI111]|uniref:hypothetical protein n=1 Tax=Pseudomonas sp. JAI111 TaxID=2735913 RepID=UPI002169D4EB|nr:hypothetical protein [Pseudomonas sp. JAI111]MCS3835655.1 hypothetical protein [Pseudomonas sp. JAI111]
MDVVDQANTLTNKIGDQYSHQWVTRIGSTTDCCQGWLLSMDINGMGSAPGLSGAPQTSCRAKRSYRLDLLMRTAERVMSQEVAWTIFSRKVSLVSASLVAKIDPVQVPCASRPCSPPSVGRSLSRQ